MKYRALVSHVIVKVIREEKTEGGIIILSTSKEHMAKEEGIVVHMGPESFEGGSYADRSVKVGDTVAFARYGGKSLGLDENGDELRVMKDVDCLAIREE